MGYKESVRRGINMFQMEECFWVKHVRNEFYIILQRN